MWSCDISRRSCIILLYHVIYISWVVWWRSWVLSVMKVMSLVCDDDHESCVWWRSRVLSVIKVMSLVCDEGHEYCVWWRSWLLCNIDRVYLITLRRSFTADILLQLLLSSSCLAPVLDLVLLVISEHLISAAPMHCVTWLICSII